MKTRWHEIVKYRPEYYENRIYTRDEWTEMCDVGRTFDGVVFTLSEYLRTEQRYVNTAIKIMEACLCQYVVIDHLEIYKSELKKDIKKSRFYKEDIVLLDTAMALHKGQRIQVQHITDVLKLCIRNHIYAVISNKSRGFKFDMGYDFYMNISCPLADMELSKIVTSEGLFLDPR